MVMASHNHSKIRNPPRNRFRSGTVAAKESENAVSHAGDCEAHEGDSMTSHKRLPKAPVRLSAGEPEVKAVPSKATLEEVRVFLERYVDEVNANVELSQGSKAIYIDHATNFVKWMYGGFQPGSRGGSRLRPKSRKRPQLL